MYPRPKLVTYMYMTSHMYKNVLVLVLWDLEPDLNHDMFVFVTNTVLPS